MFQTFGVLFSLVFKMCTYYPIPLFIIVSSNIYIHKFFPGFLFILFGSLWFPSQQCNHSRQENFLKWNSFTL
jgi:hypothetical protein